jgi:HEAT repeat protein
VSVDRDLDSLVAALEAVTEDVESAALDPDEDTEAIAALLEATDGLESDVEEAQAYDDLTVREKLAYEGFYDVLGSGNKKDFPPEWNAIKIYEREGEIEPILLAFDLLGSDFMEQHCIEAFGRMGSPEAFDPMHQRAQRRKKGPIEVLGKIGNDDALETLHPYIDGESDPGLQKIVIKAIGEIGSPESTQPVADRLVAENEEVRSRAARALGLIGDTRAIRPLADVLRDDESDPVRASAAWALARIGTERALDAASEYAEDRSFIVQSEAEWAARALGDDGSEAGESDEREQPA